MSSTEGSPLLGSLRPEIPNFVEEIPAVEEERGAEVPPTRFCTFFIEPAVLLLVFGLNLSGTIFKNQIIYQACTSVFLYNASTCSLLGTANSTAESKKIETEVQPYATGILTIKMLLEGIVPAFGGLFFGAWSDKHGRKPLLVAAFIGFSMIYIITAIICYLSQKYLISPWYYILSVVPEAILGGNCIYRIAIFCYIADITTTEQRPLRMAFLEASIYIGLMAGSFAASFIYAATSALSVFIISASIVGLTTLYIIFCVPESLNQRSRPEVNDTEHVPMRKLISEMLETCFKPRENQARLMVLLIISILFIHFFVTIGSSTVFYLFVREKFQWTVRNFTIYEAVATLVPILGNVTGMLIMRKMFSVSVTTLALLAIGSSTLSALVKGVASVPWHIYLAAGLGVFKAVGAPMCRTIVSNVVPTTDIGKIFSFVNVIESLAQYGAISMYPLLYRQTLTTYPGAFNLLSSGLLLVCFIFLAIINGLKYSKREIYGTTL